MKYGFLILIVILSLIIISIFVFKVFYIDDKNIDFQEVNIDKLNPEIKFWINNYCQENKGINMYHIDNSRNVFEAIIYFNKYKYKDRWFYSYQEIKIQRNNNVMKVYINDVDALDESQVKNYFAIYVKTSPLPKEIEFYHNGKKIEVNSFQANKKSF